MAAEVNWNGTKWIDTMGYITVKTSIDLAMSIVGNGRKDLASALVASKKMVGLSLSRFDNDGH